MDWTRFNAFTRSPKMLAVGGLCWMPVIYVALADQVWWLLALPALAILFAHYCIVQARAAYEADECEAMSDGDSNSLDAFYAFDRLNLLDQELVKRYVMKRGGHVTISSSDSDLPPYMRRMFKHGQDVVAERHR